MKRIGLIIALCLIAARAWAAPTCPANVTAISPSATSCWPMAITSGPTITDTIDSNSGTLSGTYTLNQAPGGLACDNSSGSGCNIVTPTNYANPQPMSLYVDFVGTGGGILQLGTSSSITATPYYVLMLDNYGRLTFGINNFGNLTTIQSPLPYADGNEHKAVISLGTLGAKLYVDGSLVASSGASLASYVNGYWFFGGINPANWPLSPSNQYFNGTLVTTAWWNGTQLNDRQAIQLTGGLPTPITNNYCTFTNQIASLNPSTAQAWANKKLTFTSLNTLQLPGAGSSLPIGPSTQIVCQTDSSGNIQTGCQVPQGAVVNLSVGNAPPLQITIPASTSCDLTAILMAQNDPPEVVSSVAVAGPQYAGNIVTNPPVGTIGTATITSPSAFSQTQASAATVNIGTGTNPGNGNNQQVILTGPVTITLTNWVSGASFSVDTTQDGSGGHGVVFQVPGGDTLVWSGGNVQPAMPTTASNTHVIWYFQAVSNTVLVGSLQAAGNGSFPLQSTANGNNYSITNLDNVTVSRITTPPITATATCSGTCATTYTYEATCVGDNGVEANTTNPQTAVNAASLSSSNHNTITWTNQGSCHGGYNIYGRISGSLGLLANVPQGTATYNDDGTATPGAAPPTYNHTGMFLGANLGWAMGSSGSASFADGDFFPFQGVAFSASESLMQQPAPVTGIIHNMRCVCVNSEVITLRVNGGDSTLTCSCGSGTTCSDTTHGAPVSALDLLDTVGRGSTGETACSYQIN